MTRRRHLVAEVVNWTMLVVAFVAITVGYFRLDTNQNAIEALASDRAHDNCLVQRRALKPLRDVIVFTTQPADLTGLTPERAVVVSALNVERAKARSALLALVPELHCGRV
jgi:hypothetical protein